MQALIVERDVPVEMRDGVPLRCDIYRPRDRVPVPALLLRTPYGRSTAWNVGSSMLNPLDAAQHGYAVVVQDTRGRFASEGRWTPFVDERADGHDSIAWIVEQSWSDATVGMYGSSYDGVSALQAAVGAPHQLKAVVAYITGSNYHEGWVYSSGALELGFLSRWVAGLSWDAIDRLELEAPALVAERERLARIITDPLGVLRDPAELARTFSTVAPYWGEWLQHAEYDDFWQAIDVTAQIANIETPILHVAGWHDIFLAGHLALNRALQDRGLPNAFVIGPWDHEAYLSVRPASAGRREFGPIAAGGPALLQGLVLGWFDRWVGGLDVSVPSGARYFVMGPDEWRTSDAWPPPHEVTRLFLRSAGDADEPGGSLSRETPTRDEPPDIVRFDDADPVPTNGGRTLQPHVGPGGVQIQTLGEQRLDVLTYTSSVLDEEMMLVGPVVAELSISDVRERGRHVVARLLDVAPNDPPTNVVEGISVLPDVGEQPIQITVDLLDVAYRFDAGHAIRLEIAASNFPKFSLTTPMQAPSGQRGSVSPPSRSAYGIVGAAPGPVVSMNGWNFADVFDVIATDHPDRIALIHGDRAKTWQEFERRSARIAFALERAGLVRQDKVALYLRNCPAYLEAEYGALKASLVPVNTNFRYTEAELQYIFDNSDAAAVFFHTEFTENIDRIRSSLPKVKLWVGVDDRTSGPLPEWATDYDHLITTADGGRPSGRPSGDDQFFIYTGGTTGLPKGVVWRQADLYRTLSDIAYHDPHHPDATAVSRRTTRPGPTGVAACPLMHGTGGLFALQVLGLGGAIATLESKHFDAAELLDVAERTRAASMVIVGDAFSLPMLAELERRDRTWDLDEVRFIISSGAMWSGDVKARLHKHFRNATFVDGLNSTEAMSIGRSTARPGESASTARFVPSAGTVVFGEDGEPLTPGSGEVGTLAVAGNLPLGYYGDDVKSNSTFRVVNGRRYAFTGDYATVEADGSLRLVGRGSSCINTAGEKVFPEEVEEVLKRHADILDAAVVGVDDDRRGQVVVGVVELVEGAAPETATLIMFARQHLAGYKVPRRILFAAVPRSPNGKLDHDATRALVAESRDHDR